MLKRKRPDMGPLPTYSPSARPPPPARPQLIPPEPRDAVEKFEASHVQVMRALKRARVFDTQRLVKKIQEEKEPDKVKGKRRGKPNRRKPRGKADVAADDTEIPLNTELIARLERELAVCKELDLDITARVHLAHAMSRVKALVETPGPLPAHLQVAEVLATRSKAARTEDTHNVTSSLYNKPFVREAVAQAVKEMCHFLGVSEKKAPLKKKEKEKKEKEEKPKKEKEKKEKEKKEKEKKERKEKKEKKTKVENDIDYDDADDDEIERELAKFDAMLGGDDKEGSGSDDESGSDGDDAADEDAEIAKLRAKYQRALAKGLIADDARDDYSGEEDGEDEFAGFSGGEDEDGDDSDEESSEESSEEEEESSEESEEESEEEDPSDSEEDKRPRKRAAAAAPSSGNSNFLPSLMGGFMDAGSDDDGYGSDERQRDERAAAKMLGVVRKNRRGQRARQAIWEKKYKANAKHLVEAALNPKPVPVEAGKAGKAGGWDAKRGAVDASDAPRWLRRKLGLGSKPGAPAAATAAAAAPAPKKKTNENANKQVSGTLHPSWEAARKAKEQAQTAEFKGTKIVFD